MHSINHRPRRLGGPAAAVGRRGGAGRRPDRHRAALELAGTTHPKSRAPSPRRPSTHRPRGRPSPHHDDHDDRTPAVSAPASATAHAATYHVAGASFSLSLAATTGECWVEATDTATGAVLFTGTLFAGQSHAISATGPVTVIAGAPAAFSATVDGSAVTLPLGYQAPVHPELPDGAAGDLRSRLAALSGAGQPQRVEEEGVDERLLLPGVVATRGPAVAGAQLGLAAAPGARGWRPAAWPPTWPAPSSPTRGSLSPPVTKRSGYVRGVRPGSSPVHVVVGRVGRSCAR